MSDRPIIFSGPMVRALLDGRKTQTRRMTLNWKVGDRLWVREAWKPHSIFDHLPPRDIPPSNTFFMADDTYLPSGSRVRASIHMPRWASRLTLHVTDVRVQRLDEITDADAIAEGLGPLCHPLGRKDLTWIGSPLVCAAPAFAYRKVWNGIHGRDAWDANPMVAALTFTVLRGNIDALAAQQASE